MTQKSIAHKNGNKNKHLNYKYDKTRHRVHFSKTNYNFTVSLTVGRVQVVKIIIAKIYIVFIYLS